MGNLKRNDTNELIYGKKNRLTDSENILMVARGRMVGTDRELGIHMYTLPYLKWITSKVLLYTTGNSAQCYVAA